MLEQSTKNNRNKQSDCGFWLTLNEVLQYNKPNVVSLRK